MLQNKVHGLIPINPGTKSKGERVNIVLPLFAAGNVYIPDKIEVEPGVFETCQWANEIIEQCAAFKPDKKVQRDDEVDAASQALNWLMYLPATKTASNRQRDDFGLYKQPDNPYESKMSDSYINYGLGGF
jgi:phage terminase large subunit-like protein